MDQKSIQKIKRNGRLIAFEDGWQYWSYDGGLYSIRSDGTGGNVWCADSMLNRHLHRLYQVLGYRFFTENKSMVILNRDYLSQFGYA